MDNIGIFTQNSEPNMHYDPSLEPSQQDGSNEGSQCMLWLRNRKIFPRIILEILPYHELWLGTVY